MKHIYYGYFLLIESRNKEEYLEPAHICLLEFCEMNFGDNTIILEHSPHRIVLAHKENINHITSNKFDVVPFTIPYNKKQREFLIEWKKKAKELFPNASISIVRNKQIF